MGFDEVDELLGQVDRGSGDLEDCKNLGQPDLRVLDLDQPTLTPKSNQALRHTLRHPAT
jgi:hypothetical protein